MKRIFPLILAALFIYSCSSSQRTASEEFSENLLYGSWIHSFEEDNGSEKVFRPAGAKEFGPARFRKTYEFRKNGNCVYLVLSSRDKHYTEEGRYELDGEELQIINIAGKEAERYRIISLSRNMLKLKLLGK